MPEIRVNDDSDNYLQEFPRTRRRKRVAGRKKSVFRELLGWVIYIGLILLFSWLIVTFVGQRTKVIGQSMENTLQDGDQLITDKITYRFRDPKRFDVVVFPVLFEENTYYIKRIIGLPGETVQIIDGFVYIDGKKLTNDVYGKEVMTFAGAAETPIVLGDDEYFVLGDNRNNSTDSRYPKVGNLTRKQLLGRAWVRIYPFSKMGFVKHE
ncbi:MAG: signal peptidase I [Lachnospiraceae bacterium]|jgi:signal peptidase I|nr:signal peptidase I [Lachnospiraceae bacterium]